MRHGKGRHQAEENQEGIQGILMWGSANHTGDSQSTHPLLPTDIFHRIFQNGNALHQKFPKTKVLFGYVGKSVFMKKTFPFFGVEFPFKSLSYLALC